MTDDFLNTFIGKVMIEETEFAVRCVDQYIQSVKEIGAHKQLPRSEKSYRTSVFKMMKATQIVSLYDVTPSQMDLVLNYVLERDKNDSKI